MGGRLKGRISAFLRRATDESIRADVVGALFLLGALLSALTLTFPHPDQGQPAILAVVVVASIIGGVLLWRSTRISIVAFHAAVASGSLLINALMLASGVAAGVYAAMFNWVVLVIFNFFSLRAAAAHFAWMMVGYGVVLTMVDSSGGYAPITRWIIATMALAVTGGATAWLVFRRRLAEESTRRFLDLSHEMLCTIGGDGRFAKLNPAWERALGYSADELCARPVSSLIHRADRVAAELAFARLRNLHNGTQSVLLDIRCRDRDGDWHELLWTVSYSADEDLIYARVRPRRADEGLSRVDVPLEQVVQA